MSTEEPAWKAELRKDAKDRIGCYTPDEVLAVVLPHIQAAEERGRREALREAAQKLRKESRSRISGIGRSFYAHSADLIDPDKEKV